MEKNINYDIFKQLQEVICKCDKLTEDVKNIKAETEYKTSEKYNVIIASLNARLDILEKENAALKIENKKKDERILLLEKEIDRLKSQLNKNSNNSSKPSSTDNKNIPNNREKTNKKTGGQYGHIGATFSKQNIEDKIKEGSVEHVVINHGNINSSDFEVRYEVSTKMIVTVKEHRFYKGSNNKYNIPKQFRNNVVYGDEIKSMCTLFSTDSSTSINKIVSILSSLTNNIINLSEGTVVNFLKEFSLKATTTLENITNKILDSPLMHTDETGSRCGGKRISIRNYSTKNHAIFKVNKNKSKASIETNNILNRYCGDISHDHDTVIYGYGKRHPECNTHITRYLTGNNENTTSLWSRHLRKLLLSVNNTRSKLLLKNINSFSNATLEKLEKRYDDILEEGFKENKRTSSIIYRADEKRLLNRLLKYKENHLLFIHDFTLPFSNNMSEQDIRVFKSKTKVSGGFRSFDGAIAFANALSIIKSSRKQRNNVFENISNIYKFSFTNI